MNVIIDNINNVLNLIVMTLGIQQSRRKKIINGLTHWKHYKIYAFKVKHIKLIFLPHNWLDFNF